MRGKYKLGVKRKEYRRGSAYWDYYLVVASVEDLARQIMFETQAGATKFSLEYIKEDPDERKNL